MHSLRVKNRTVVYTVPLMHNAQVPTVTKRNMKVVTKQLTAPK